MSWKTHDGKVAVVTGASRGIGRAIAAGLARRGAHLIVVDKDDPADTIDGIRAEGGAADPYIADVSDEDQVTEVADIHGGADILVNNAGIYPFVRSEIGGEDAHRRPRLRHLAEGPRRQPRRAIPARQSTSAPTTNSGSGRIVNLTSNSIGLAVPHLTHYMASKMGVIGFTRALANDVAADGITVNAVGPTLSLTPGVRAAVPDELVTNLSNSQAIKKPGEAADVVGTVLLLTRAESYFVTGQTIMSDGGLVRL
ncbi:SDR family NAD(P)-dependent oxidoreductase [Rhodococcus aetherivorans]|uniref:SDR family NAD(P)-dependent oxidoreductase n=1 Tax=Rhodococcus aetherivorans TaxID=191292 RepID=UPI000ABA9409|nr:SDR family oxidoreductase [Rhodococcus aetherivorans]